MQECKNKGLAKQDCIAIVSTAPVSLVPGHIVHMHMHNSGVPLLEILLYNAHLLCGYGNR